MILINRYFLSVMGIIGFAFISAQDVTEVDFNYVSKMLNAMSPNFSKGTARSAAMAGSMGALGADMTAVNINPAGTGVFIKSQLALTLDYGNTRDKCTLASSNNSDNNHFEVNQLGGIIRFPIDNENWLLVNLGLLYDHQNLSETVDFGPSENISISDFDASGETVNQYGFNGYIRERDGSKEKFTMSLSTNYRNKLFLGMNINIHSYNMSYENQFIGKSDDLVNSTRAYQSWGFPYEEQGSGLSIGLGAIFKPVNEFRAGIAFQSPIGWSDISTEYPVYYYDTTSGLVDSYVEEGLWEEDRATSAGFLNLSTALVIKKDFALNFDYIHYLNSSNKYKPSSYYTGTNAFLKKYVENNNEFRVGAEYRYKNFRFRGGYALVTPPIKNVDFENGYLNGVGVNENSAVKDFLMGEKRTIGAGLGYQLNHLGIDFAYQNMSQKYSTLLYGSHVQPGEYPLDFPEILGNVNQKVSNYILTLSVTF